MEYEKVCANCGKPYVSSNYHSKYCSAACRKAKTNANRSIKRAKMKKEKPQKVCANCGNLFTPNTANEKYCSDRCRCEQDRKRKLERYAEVSALKRMEKVYYKTCPICGKSFMPDNKNQKYCSKDCYAVANAENTRKRNEERKGNIMERECPVCLEYFKPSHRAQIYCSDGCAKVAKNELSAVRRKQGQGVDEKRICLWCGKEYIANRPLQKYCSDKCKYEAKRKRMADAYENGTNEVICAYCGKKFERHSGNRRFCSDECRDKYAYEHSDIMRPVRDVGAIMTIIRVGLRRGLSPEQIAFDTNRDINIIMPYIEKVREELAQK